jgi:hypothetical protein
MRKVIVVIFVSLTVVSFSQDRGTGMVLRPSGPVPHWDKGTVEGRTYRNASLGIEVTPPLGLEFFAPELKGDSGTLPLLVTITAIGEDKLHTANSKVMAFYSDALAYYPSTRRSTDAYMLRIVRNQHGDGYEPVGSTSQAKLGGFVFARQDFKKGDVYESFFVKACDVQALVFIFGGADLETVNSMNTAMELKLDLAAGCSSNAPTPVKK